MHYYEQALQKDIFEPLSGSCSFNTYLLNSLIV